MESSWVDPSKRFSTYLVTFIPSDFMPAEEWKSFTSSVFKKAFLERSTTPRVRASRQSKQVPDHNRTTIYADSMEDALEARDILYGVLIERGRRDAVEADIARPRVFGSTKKAKTPKTTVSAAWTSFPNAPPSSTGGASVEFAPGEGESKLPRGLLNRKKSRKGERHGRRTRRRRSF